MTEIMTSNKTYLACIAHDGKKPEMVHLAMKFSKAFNGYNIVATGTTGKHIRNTGIEVNEMLSGPMGGDAQIAAKIVDKDIDYVIFFIDPLSSHPHEVDVQMVLRICNVTDTPIATNYSTASMMIKYLENEEI